MAATDVISRLRDIELAEIRKADSVRTPPGSNNVKYNTAFYGHEVSDPTGNRFRWCVVFQWWWCCNMAGVDTSIFPKTASVATEAELRQVVRDEVMRVLDSQARRVQGIVSWERYLQVLLDAARKD